MYNPNFDNPQQKNMSAPGLAALNDVIITEAIKVYIYNPRNTQPIINFSF